MTLCPQLRRLSAEHARWLAEIAGWARAGEEGRSSKLLLLWETEILPHCRAEEDVLLPELAARLSDADAAIVFTQSDHCALRRLARELRDAADGTQRIAAREALERKLREHADFEERTLFPAIQEALGCNRIAALAADVTAARAGSVARSTSSTPGASRKGRRKSP